MDNILFKIKKLKQKAESAKQLGSINEYLAFTGKVKQLMDAHMLAWWQLEECGPEGNPESITSGYVTSEPVPYGRNWQKLLLDALAKAHYCSMYWVSRKRVCHVYGRGEQVEVVGWLYRFLSEHFKQKSSAYATPRERHDFLVGCVTGVKNTLIRLTKSQASELILYNKEALAQYSLEQKINPKVTGLTNYYRNEAIFQQGVQTGENVKVQERRLA